MSLILTFLGKGGVGKTTAAIAVARGMATQGQRVLLVGQQVGGSLAINLGWQGRPLDCDPQEIVTNFSVAQLYATTLLERYWDRMKTLESQFLRTPFFQEVYGQELGILPGMDGALGLSWLRERDAEATYDVIIYDGAGDLATLRMLGMPEILGWYLRRFRQVLTTSALGQAMSPFVEPMLRSIMQVSTTDGISQQAGQMTDVLSLGQQAVGNPSRVAAYLVTTNDPGAIATARYLWGSAQQVGLTVGGVLARGMVLDSEFAALPLVELPEFDQHSLPEFRIPDSMAANLAPPALAIDIINQQVKLFLPTFDKRQVKLIQSGPEITIEAGDQRRNLFLPKELTGKQATGAKFLDGYLIISFG